MADDSPTVRISVLGGLRVSRDGHELVLPGSKKTRALLGYLVVTGQPHRRERLCDLLWDGPDDPRAELRWSVSKLRPIVNGPGATRLVSEREQIGFVPERAAVDLLSVRSLIRGGIAAALTERLQAAAGLFRGELLDGLDLPICYRYQEWCIAEREAANRLHRTILAALVSRLEDQPEDALTYARALVAVDPLEEPGHAAMIRVLDRLGRKREALAHFERARQILAAELGVSPGNELLAAYRSLQSVTVAAPSVSPPVPATPRGPRPGQSPATGAFMAGRHDECRLIEGMVATAVAQAEAPVVLVTGEPGIGKSHLLAQLEARMTAAGGLAHGARAFEAEAARPYGIWIDLLRPMIQARHHDHVPPDLSLLLPELGATAGDTGDQARLFDAVVAYIRQLAADQAVAITLDDLQWIDDASCSLLHYLARQLTELPGLLLAVAARAGEIDDNSAAASVVRSLHRDGRVQHIALVALSAPETAALVRTVAPRLDPARVVAESEGIPLFAIELARADQRGDSGTGRTIERVVAGQLARLRDDARDLLVWAAALDRDFTPDYLARIAGRDVAELLASLDELERHGLLRPTGDETYNFGHDLIRQATYQSMSQPRRTVVHRQIARVLMAGTEDPLAGDAAHHAALGNDHELAARACVAAGERALRLYANEDASGFADRGARHLERLPWGPLKVEITIALLNVQVMAVMGPGLRPLPPIVDDLASMTAAAEAFGLHAPAVTGHYLLSVLHQEAGNQPQAEQSTLRAARVGRVTDQTIQAHQLANTARCLLELETQIPRTRILVAEAEGATQALGSELCELEWARGLLQRWDGDLISATHLLLRALALARHTEDLRRECKCLTWLAMLAYEQGQYGDTGTHCTQLVTIAKQAGDDDTPCAMVMQALAALTTTDLVTRHQLDVALQRLRVVDDKSYLAYALNAAAELMLEAGDVDAARGLAREALTASSLMQRHNDMAIAWALLARIGDAEAISELQRLVGELTIPDWLGARARASVQAAAAVHGISTRTPTLPSHA